MQNCCPTPTALSAISASTCLFNVKQLSRLIFQRNVSGSVFLDATNKLELLSSHTAFKSAIDDTKEIVTPYISADPVIEGGKAITKGGNDNSTRNGAVIIKGTEVSTLTAKFWGLTPAQKTEMQALSCETNLGMIIINQDGDFFADLSGTVDHKVIPIQSFHLSDRQVKGHLEDDEFELTISLVAGWDDNLQKVSPASGFDPNTEL